MAVKIGIDTGGTFTDCILMRDGRLAVHKVLSTPDNPARAVLEGLRALCPELMGVQLVHGSTVATNALLERKGARTALITTKGFEDVLEIGRQTRPHLYDPFVTKPPPLVPARWRFGVRERLAASGEVLQPLTPAEVEAVLARVRRSGAESLAICLLHAYANPVHEQQLAQAAAQLGIPVSASHQVLPEFREYERCSTTVVNAYLRPVMQRYLETLVRELAGTHLSIMRSNGGIMSAQRAQQEAVHTILSGPAGGVVGAFRVAQDAGYRRAITFDMGGTSTDVSLCDEQPRTTSETVIAGCPVKVPVIDIHTVGAGGGSLAYLDRGGALRVGPQSAGADPGPVCYGKGQALTVTDANLYLGRLHPDWFLGGAMRLDVERTRAAVRDFARRLRRPPEEACEGILEVANANMEGAIRVISVERGYDPREFVLVSFGGAGSMHAADLARRLAIPEVLVPANPGILSAFGMLISDYVQEFAQTVLVPAEAFTPERAAQAFAALEERGRQAMQEEGVPAEAIRIHRFLDMCYVGQSYELTVPYTPRFVEAFHRQHEWRYGYEDSRRPTLVVNVRVRVEGPSGTAYHPPRQPEVPGDGRAAQVDTVAMYVGGRWQEARVYDRQRLQPGDRLRGPALIVEYSATTVVPPDFVARVDGQQNLVLRRGET
ncbi:MAG: N-methylhydantoinase A [Candidatus Tectimicrobiota bacterium]|nr:MAG: N-methylhydantoinase A [Candidatus Tectomicrobia bacterium]